jgi:methylated-DNA-[protein]-cysteine S-methyltransferase
MPHPIVSLNESMGMKSMKSTIEYFEHPSPLGPLLLAAGAGGLVGVYYPQHNHFAGKQDWQPAGEHALLNQAARQLDEYFAGQRQVFDLTLAPEGTLFQTEVWQGLRQIPYGCTRNYSELAQAIARPKAVRAVGAANARNPLSIIVPCHRVIGRSGDLVGYAGGLERKQFLLALEKAGSGQMALI